MRLPSFHQQANLRTIGLMIVGAPKAGTTSLKSYLGQHPQIFVHSQRELIFFASDNAYFQGYDSAWRLYFSQARSDQVLAGKSVAMMYSTVAMRRLKQHNPDVQVVLVLRDPVARAYSEFWYARRRGREASDTFGAAVERCLNAPNDDPLRPTAYLARGRYVQYVERVFELFPPTQVSVFLLEHIREKPVDVCRSLFRRLEAVDAGFAPVAIQQQNISAESRTSFLLSLTSDRNRLSMLRRGLRSLISERTKQNMKSRLQRTNDRPFSPPAMSDEMHRRLAEYFEPWNRKLEEMLSVKLDLWTSRRDGTDLVTHKG
jgi:hypothetical protein